MTSWLVTLDLCPDLKVHMHCINQVHHSHDCIDGILRERHCTISGGQHLFTMLPHGPVVTTVHG